MEALLSTQNVQDPVETGTVFARMRDGVAARSKGPGGLYNIGNVVALIGGMVIQSIAVERHSSLNEVVFQYLFGSPAATSLTLAVLIFLASGEVYHRAWSHHGNAALRMVRVGDALSGLAAVVLTVALVQVGDPWLGLTGGVMLIIGKFGTAILPERPDASRRGAQITKLLRLVVVASRGPSLAALVVTIIVTATDGALAGLAMPLLMVLCYLLWLWADILLLRLSARPPHDIAEPSTPDSTP
ncbi:hypothetical protein [Jannaschia sp. CCS1]|uniref:hypothetical protein n=1 Tax=Jannaschia sp. (strain CCS1) TaxID=290400 RepID=UPI000053A2AE|nr:hypothetical protein [Jannaschia sp. CCS1]ABD54949.1 hypothetical protein Jann_2032 [Jannaschia sp. CCS1]